MIEYITPPVAANPEGEALQLNRDQLWQALMWKGEFAHLFVAPIVECNVIERFEDGFYRSIVVANPDGSRDTMQERIITEPGRKMTFLRLDGPVYGHIVNLIDPGDEELTLRFGFTFGLPGAVHGGPEEQAYKEKFAAGYVEAIHSTLATARELIRSGRQPSSDMAPAPA
jgi:hypothetical protein